MRPEESEQRLQDAFRSLSRGARPREDCPAPEALWAASQGESSLQERREVITHTSSCFSCAEDWRLAKAASEAWEQGAAEEGAPPLPFRPRALPEKTPARSPLRRQLIALAAILGFAVVGLRLYQKLWLVDPIYRQADETSVRSLLVEDVVLAPEECVLRWTAAGSDVRYDLLLTTGELEEIFTVDDLIDTEYRVPVEALAGLGDGAELFRRVGLTFPDGSRRESQTFDFRLGPSAGEVEENEES